MNIEEELGTYMQIGKISCKKGFVLYNKFKELGYTEDNEYYKESYGIQEEGLKNNDTYWYRPCRFINGDKKINYDIYVENQKGWIQPQFFISFTFENLTGKEANEIAEILKSIDWYMSDLFKFKPYQISSNMEDVEIKDFRVSLGWLDPLRGEILTQKLIELGYIIDEETLKKNDLIDEESNKINDNFWEKTIKFINNEKAITATLCMDNHKKYPRLKLIKDFNLYNITKEEADIFIKLLKSLDSEFQGELTTPFIFNNEYK